jgi:lactoylglutathione lyase
MQMNEVVPFLAVKDMAQSLAFYVDGLGFTLQSSWVDEGVTRWCRLQNGKAGLMLQQFHTEGPDARTFAGAKGEGVVFCLFCDDVPGLYRALAAKRVPVSEPVVGNGLWVSSVTDPDGYRIDFESPTDAPEDSALSAMG